MSPDRIAGLALVACAVLLALPSILVRALTWIEGRRKPKATPSWRLIAPLPAVDADDDACTYYAGTVVPACEFRESETFGRICDALARNEAGRTDWDNRADHFGGEAS